MRDAVVDKTIEGTKLVSVGNLVLQSCVDLGVHCDFINVHFEPAKNNGDKTKSQW